MHDILIVEKKLCGRLQGGHAYPIGTQGRAQGIFSYPGNIPLAPGDNPHGRTSQKLVAGEDYDVKTVIKKLLDLYPTIQAKRRQIQQRCIMQNLDCRNVGLPLVLGGDSLSSNCRTLPAVDAQQAAGIVTSGPAGA